MPNAKTLRPGGTQPNDLLPYISHISYSPARSRTYTTP